MPTLSLDCLDLVAPLDLLTCFDTMSGGVASNIIFLGIMMVFIIGWSLKNGFENGLMIGGFFGVLVGAGFFALGLLSLMTVMIAVILLLLGIGLRLFTLMSYR